jgi:hypothetical protein
MLHGKKNNPSIARIEIKHADADKIKDALSDAEQLSFKGISVETPSDNFLNVIYDLTKWENEGLNKFIGYTWMVKQCEHYKGVEVALHLPIHWTEFLNRNDVVNVSDIEGIPIYVDGEVINLKPK